MSEYKNGVNAFGNMSVDKADYANEVHTGRAVFVNEDKYANDAKYKAKVDQCLAEGFHKVGSSEGGGGGSSDFSTATVTLVNNTDDYAVLDFPKVASLPSGTYTTANSPNGDPHTTEEVVIALAEDGCVVLPSGISGTVEVSGDATIGDRGMIIITGDCTITIGQASVVVDGISA